MEHWNKSSTYLKEYSTAALRDVLFRVPSIFVFGFLVYLQFWRREIYRTYKFTVFCVTYTYFALTMPLFISDIHNLVFSFYGITVPLGYCAFWKGSPVYFPWTFDAYSLAVSFSRYLLIIWKRELPNYLVILLISILSIRHVSHMIASLFFGYPVPNDCCTPSLSTSFLGGYATVAIVLWAYNVTAAVINLRILFYMSRHYRNQQGRTMSSYQMKDQRNLVYGLLAQSALPIVTQGLTLFQIYSVLLRLSVPLYVSNPILFVARTLSFWRMTLPFIFVRAFQDELRFLIFRGKTPTSTGSHSRITVSISMTPITPRSRMNSTVSPIA